MLSLRISLIIMAIIVILLLVFFSPSGINALKKQLKLTSKGKKKVKSIIDPEEDELKSKQVKISSHKKIISALDELSIKHEIKISPSDKTPRASDLDTKLDKYKNVIERNIEKLRKETGLKDDVAQSPSDDNLNFDDNLQQPAFLDNENNLQGQNNIDASEYSSAIENYYKKYTHQKPIIDYSAYIEVQGVENLEKNALSDVAFQVHFRLIYDWWSETVKQLEGSISLEFISKKGDTLLRLYDPLTETVFEKKSWIRKLSKADICIHLMLCESQKTVTIDMIKYFQHQAESLANKISSDIVYLSSERELYENIQEVARLKKLLDKVFLFQINAKESHVFQGKDIKEHAIEMGYSYGYRKLFHKYSSNNEFTADAPKHGFTLINRYAPGYFEFEQLNQMTTKGLCLIIKPVLSDKPQTLLNEYIDQVQQWKHRLDGDLYYPREKFSIKTYQDNVNKVEQFRFLSDDLKWYLEKLKQENITCGSEVAARLFGF